VGEEARRGFEVGGSGDDVAGGVEGTGGIDGKSVARSVWRVDEVVGLDLLLGSEEEEA
jgi:hypothetical protein